MHIPYECYLCHQQLPNDVLVAACKCNHLFHETCVTRFIYETNQRICGTCHTRWNTLLMTEEPNSQARCLFCRGLLLDLLVVLWALFGSYIWMGGLFGYLWLQHFCPSMPPPEMLGFSAAIGIGSTHVILACYYAYTLPWRNLQQEMSPLGFWLWIIFLLVTAIPASLVFLLYQVYVARVATTVFASPLARLDSPLARHR